MNGYGLVVGYEHHGRTMFVREDLVGKHRDACLCYSCTKFNPGEDDNCPIAQAVYKNCVEFGIVSPVWECSKYSDK